MRFLPIILTSLALLLHSCHSEPGVDYDPELLNYVNPFIGTTNFGTTNPGAVCPNGMMSVSPFNVMGSDSNVYDKDSRWWSTPYTHENSFFTGFSHVNLSGVGCPELGSLLTMPTAGPLEVDYHVYGSEYSNEEASPGYYSNVLSKYGIKTEVTSTLRSSCERYTFPEGQANILLNLGEGLTNESGAMVRRVSDTEIEGMKLLGTFCYNPQAVFPIYFVLRVSKTPRESGYWKKQRPMTGVEAEWTPDNGKYKLYTNYGKEVAGDDIGYWFSFDVQEGESIELQLGVSFVSIENARENLYAEQGGVFDFEGVLENARKSWGELLSRIKVSGGTEDLKTVFYTALYHSLIHPNILNDNNGEYPMMENFGIGKVNKGQNRYTVFSLWDTYRNLHQLMTLVYPDRQMDMIRSMVDMYCEWGWMPKWELYGRETFTMEGDPAIPVIVDSWLKGLKDFDIEKAYEAFVRSATSEGKLNIQRPDIDPYLEKGYIPLGYFAADLSGDNSVSHALEYYVADHALSLLAADLGKTEDATRFKQASMGYKNYYCPEFGTLRPLTKSGEFYSPFNPRDGENFENTPGFHEGSAWNYTFFVPHDVHGLAELMGGEQNFVDKLQMVFDEGLYDPANEPDIAYPYLFSYFPGQEWRTHETVKTLLEKYYKNAPNGIPGNDDSGAMSAWAVFSMMGFYPDCPGLPEYTLTVPSFEKIKIRLDPKYHKGTSLTIENKTSSRARKVLTGNQELQGFRIAHSELIKAGEIVFE